MLTKTDLIRELGTAADLARAAKVTRQAVYQWSEKIPLERCRTIESNTRFTVHQLRPDHFGPAPGVPPIQATPNSEGDPA